MNSSNGRLQGKVALITGGTSGIGRAIACHYAAEGAFVVVAARTREAREGGAPTDELIRLDGGSATYFELDVRNSAMVAEVVEKTISTAGGLHVLVCSHGAIGAAGDSRQVDPAAFDEQFSVDVRGAFLCAQSALKHFVAERFGKIVMVSSNFGIVGVSGLAAYCAAKAAVIGLVRAMAVEFAPVGININALCPGATRTATGDSYRQDPAIVEHWKRMTPLRLPGGQFIADAEDIAQAAVFLATDASRFMTGEALVVDGGWTAQ